MTSLRRFFSAVLATSLMAAVAGVAGATPAPAEPDHASGAPSVEVLAEQYNLARYRLEQTTAALGRTEARIAEARAKADALRALARARAASLYRRAAGSGPQVLAADSMGDLARRTEYVSAAEAPDRRLLEDLETSVARLAEEREAQQATRGRLQEQAAAAAAAKARLQAEAANAAAAGANGSASSGGDGAGPIGTPKVLRGTPAAAPSPSAPTTTPTSAPAAGQSPAPAPAPTPAPTPAPAPTPPPTTAAPAPPPSPPAPPVSGGAGAAVAFARAQLGKPYVFATSGPSSYDCSGLTMAAWRAGGVRMPHYSGSQAAMFPKVAWSQLQPGDLVFFYADLHHVGIYIGGGQMIHAPQTGDVVKVSPAWRTTFQFGVRPR